MYTGTSRPRKPRSRIAERVLALYYPQARTYVAHDGVARELRQISMRSSPVLGEVLRLRLAGDAARSRTTPTDAG